MGHIQADRIGVGTTPAGRERIPAGEAYGAFDEERWAPEPPKSKSRTAFERDRARLIHSSALRRLGAKSQVLVAGTDDFARTRLTHTLEVAQIGRQIGALLGCDPDIVDCACLAHDLGHPPFGHNGEHALAAIAEHIGGFEGNAQTLRLLTRLEPKVFHADGRSAGVNVMDLSDDIAYSVHDVEDAIATGAFNPLALADPRIIDRIVEEARAWYGSQWDGDKLVAAFERLQRLHMFPAHFNGSRAALAQLKNITSDLIGRFAWSVETATRDTYGDGPLVRYSANVVIPEETS